MRDRLLKAAQAYGVALGMAFLDGTGIRAHQKAAGAVRKEDFERSGTHMRHSDALAAVVAPKACVIAYGKGWADLRAGARPAARAANDAGVAALAPARAALGSR